MLGRSLAKEILNGSRYALSKAITMIESSLSQHRLESLSLLSSLPNVPNTLRIGICGSPGAGKSTLIEALGLHLISIDKKPAVLAIDPSSVTHGGSILGDKTRMLELSINPKAYVRPSPTRGNLGGVTVCCSESISLCENAGFNPVIIETVGLGQSETTVDEVTDLVMFVTNPVAGDSLQGIKKGIMEVADVIIVNKADGALAERAKYTKYELEQAVNLNLRRYHCKPEIVMCSALNKTGIDLVWKAVEITAWKLKQEIVDKRNRQMRQNTRRMLEALIRTRIREMENTSEFKNIVENEGIPRAAATKLLSMIFKS